jgi:hypothetical protein
LLCRTRRSTSGASSATCRTSNRCGLFSQCNLIITIQEEELTFCQWAACGPCQLMSFAHAAVEWSSCSAIGEPDLACKWSFHSFPIRHLVAAPFPRPHLEPIRRRGHEIGRSRQGGLPRPQARTIASPSPRSRTNASEKGASIRPLPRPPGPGGTAYHVDLGPPPGWLSGMPLKIR